MYGLWHHPRAEFRLMTDDRKNIKVDPETFARLEAEKSQHETWDHAFNRILDTLDAQRG
jgi:hypothetical protein